MSYLSKLYEIGKEGDIDSEIRYDIERMKTARVGQLKRWDENIRIQEFKIDPNIDLAEFRRQGRSTLNMPLSFAFVEGRTCDERATLPYPVVLPGNKKSMESNEKFEGTLQYTMNNVMKMNEKLFLMLQTKNIFGDAFIKTYWNTEKRMQSILKGGKWKSIEITINDNIKADVLDPRSVLIDPICYASGKTIRDATKIAFVQQYDFKVFKDVFKRAGYENIDKVMPGLDATYEGGQSDAELQAAYGGENMVEVIEFWDILNDQLVTLAGGTRIRKTPCPYQDYINGTGAKYLPIAHFVCHKWGTGFWNPSTIDVTKDPLEEVNSQFRINSDTAKVYTQPQVFIGGNNDFDVDDIVYSAGGVHRVSDINQVKFMNMQTANSLPFNIQASAQEFAIISEGYDIRSILGDPNISATQYLGKQQSGMKRIKGMSSFNEDHGFNMLYENVANLIMQYYPDQDREINYEDKKGNVKYETVRKNDKMYSNKYKICIVANNQIPASTEVQKMRDMEALQFLAQVPTKPMDPNNPGDPEAGKVLPHMVDAVKKVLFNMGIPEERVKAIFPDTEEEEEKKEKKPSDLKSLLQSIQGDGVDVGVKPAKPDEETSESEAVAAMMTEMEGEGIPTAPPTSGKQPPKKKPANMSAAAQIQGPTQKMTANY
jgi:hypothetical protein